LDLEITSDCGCLGNYFEKLFEPLGKIIFPVGSRLEHDREAFGALDSEVLCAVMRDTKKGKMFLESACQVLLRRGQLNRQWTLMIANVGLTGLFGGGGAGEGVSG